MSLFKSISKITKIIKKVDPIGAGIAVETDKAWASFGMPNGTGQETPAQAAAKQALDAQNQQAAYNAQLLTMQNNLATDLKGDNVANVVAGGTADATATSDDSIRKRTVGGLSSALGV